MTETYPTPIYGKTDTGADITAPEGWELLPEGAPVVQPHRYADPNGVWSESIGAASSMTPASAVCTAYARAWAKFIPLSTEAPE